MKTWFSDELARDQRLVQGLEVKVDRVFFERGCDESLVLCYCCFLASSIVILKAINDINAHKHF